MLCPTLTLLKKGWTYSPGKMGRGAKNMIWNPKMGERQLRPFLFLNFEHPRRRPDSWTPFEFRRLGMSVWPKEVGFFNAGDNFEITPEMAWRMFRMNGDKAPWWTREDNEATVVNLLPLVEKDPASFLPRVEEVFTGHVERFGVDHLIYNAVLQAVAFARDLERCKEIFAEMKAQGLAPNAQTYVNMMLAARLSHAQSDEAKARQIASEFFSEAVSNGAMNAVMRLDTEFQMWWDQLSRMGSFTEGQGFLANRDEGAKPMPRDIWALWGWDSRHERKFLTPNAAVFKDTTLRRRDAKHTAGNVFNSYRREPWHRYAGPMRSDFKGPPFVRLTPWFRDSPAPQRNKESCGSSY